MKAQLLKFWRDEEGATAIEYGLIAGLVAVAIIAALGVLSGGLNDIFSGIGEKLSDVGDKVKTETPVTPPVGGGGGG